MAVTPGTPRLEVLGATVRFGDRSALDQLDLSVAPGEVVAVLGPSGSGKSTLLRAVAGLQALDAGSIHLDGDDLAGVPAHRRGIGLMFQQQALFPHRDVAGNVGFGLRMAGVASRGVQQRVDELLDLVGLSGFGSRAVAELSGGEQQRVALARALAPSPKALLLDEPLGALDRTLRDRLVGELRSLFTEQELTAVAVTHDQAEAFALADRIAVVDRGRLLQAGAPGEVWGRPATRRVAELLGFPNLVDAVATQGLAPTPWGPVPVAAADGPVTVVVRPEGVLLDPDGPLVARVVEVAFGGATTTVDLDLEGGGRLRAEVPSPVAPSRGDRIRVALGPGAVSSIAR